MGAQEEPMVGRSWLQPPRRVLTSFLVVVVACVGALAWLGYRLLDQDRALESQRIQGQLEIAADLTAASLERKLADLGKALDGPPGDAKLPDGTILIVAGGRNFDPYGSRRLLFYPEFDAPPIVADDTLLRGELIEFQKNSPLAAAALYREAARTQDPAVRAAALVRLGRSLRKAGRTREALDAYSELAALGSTAVSGLPAELLAREGRCSALAESGQHDELKREAAALLRDLETGRWRLTRSAYEFRANEARGWLGDGTQPQPLQPPPSSEATAPPTDTIALSLAVSNLVDEWRAGPDTSSGQRVSLVNTQPVLAVWRATPAHFTAAVAGPQYLTSLWRDAQPDQSGRTRLTLTDPQGRTIFGTLPATAERVAVRTGAVTKLPWTLHVSAADQTALASGMAARRRLLLAGLSILTLLLVATSYFIVRAMSRELAVARLQSDFVASVSHEFRSPLTSMRQLSSMLVQGRLPSEEQRQRSYEFLADETGRLDRLIEGLLDFGLMEAGEARYRLESTDAGELVRDTVAAFQRTVFAKGYQVVLSLPASASGAPAGKPAAPGGAPVGQPAAPHRILADKDALGRAIWNLLNNAVKYSPDERTVWVDVAPAQEKDRARLAIVVKDRGMGIPAAEQRTIFNKFVRGANSREAGIKGTGLGLAMVKHIVAAHGGDIRLESAPGEGSRFTILLPMAPIEPTAPIAPPAPTPPPETTA
jgi:signal transduction histidine kinase